MSNIVEFPGVTTKDGDLAFITCPCSPDGDGFEIVVIADQKRPIISALVCPVCEQQFDVVNGIVDLEGLGPDEE